MTTKTDRPDWKERLCYGAGGIGIRACLGAVSAFLLIYLTNVALLDVAAVSAIIGVSKVFDGISDIVIGNIIDDTDSRFGKARVWLLRMCFPLAFTMVLLFWVPSGFPQLLKYVYVFLMYNLVNAVLFTFMQISHYSMVSLISDDPKEHGLLSSVQAVSRSIGGLLCGAGFVRLLSVMTDEPGNQNTQVAYTRSVLLVVIAMIALTLITVMGTKERVRTQASVRENNVIRRFFRSLLPLLKSRYWIVIIVCYLLFSMGMQLMVAGCPYFSLYILHDMNYMSLILMATLLPGMAMQAAMPLLYRRFGNRQMYIAGLIIAIAGLLGVGLTSPSIVPVVVFNALLGTGTGLVRGITIALTADIISHTEHTTGRMIAGLGNAGISATDKLGMGLGSTIFGMGLSLAGFNAALDAQGIAQPVTAEKMISMLFIWLPALLFVVVIVIFVLFFDLERKGKNED